MSGIQLHSSLHFAEPAVDMVERDDGCILLQSPLELLPHAKNTSEWLENWATRAPQRVFLTERHGDGSREITYLQAWKTVQRVAQALLSRGLNADTPVVVLSENSIDHALLGMAAMHIGVPYIPVSAAYSMMSSDFAKLRAIIELVKPGLVHVSNPNVYAKALAAIGFESTALTDLLNESPGPDVASAHALVTPDTVGKILFTSGSTGMPKGVLNTQRMMTVNQQQTLQLWPWLSETPPVMVDWLPWNHTAGGNFDFNMVLANGGRMHIDNGKPMPGMIDETIRNLREFSPNLYINVPRGYSLLVPELERDAKLRRHFFEHCKMVFYAGAALPQNLWEAFERMARDERGSDLSLVAAWGSTETAPMCTTVYYPSPRAGILGLPAPGCELKLVPNGGKLEVRLRGPNVFPGYFGRDELTAAAFDDEGFYIIGDALRLADPDNPVAGVEFDGRVAENFKLRTGTWVHVGALRIELVAAGAPIVMDAVITGHDRDEVGALVFINPSTIEGMSAQQIREKLAEILADFNSVGRSGSSTRISRALILDAAPNQDAGEITDKGYLNQRALLQTRAQRVQALYADSAEVIYPASKI